MDAVGGPDAVAFRVVADLLPGDRIAVAVAARVLTVAVNSILTVAVRAWTREVRMHETGSVTFEGIDVPVFWQMYESTPATPLITTRTRRPVTRPQRNL